MTATEDLVRRLWCALVESETALAWGEGPHVDVQGIGVAWARARLDLEPELSRELDRIVAV